MLPVATRLVVHALRAEADSMVRASSDEILVEIAGALEAVADRLERAGSSVRPSAARAPSPAPAICEPDPEPTQVDGTYPGPVVKVTHPTAAHATLIELKRLAPVAGEGIWTERMQQLLDDAIRLSS